MPSPAGIRIEPRIPEELRTKYAFFTIFFKGISKFHFHFNFLRAAKAAAAKEKKAAGGGAASSKV